MNKETSELGVMVKLGSIMRIFTGRKNVNASNASGAYAFFSCSPSQNYSDEYICDSDALIITGNGAYTGTVRFFSGKFDLYQRTYACVLNEGKGKHFDSKFLYYFAKKYFEKKYMGGSRGSTIPYILKGDLENFLVPKPKLGTQKAIAEILSSFDDKIDLLRRQNKTLEELAQTLIRQRFIDHNFQNWKKAAIVSPSLSNLIGNGIHEFKGEKTYLPTAAVQQDVVTDRSTKITHQNRTSRANMQPVEYSIWFAKKGGVRKVLMFDDFSRDEINSLILSTGFSGLKTTAENHYYLWCFILSDRFQEIKDALLSGSVQPDINNEGIKKIFIPVPDAKILTAFNEQVRPMFHKIQLNRAQIRTLANLRDTLLPKLMRGEIRV